MSTNWFVPFGGPANPRPDVPANAQHYPPGCPDPDYCRGNNACVWNCKGETPCMDCGAESYGEALCMKCQWKLNDETNR